MYWNESIAAGNFLTHFLAFQPGSSVCEGFILLWRAVFCAGRGRLPDLVGLLPSPAAVIKSIGLDFTQATLLWFSIRASQEKQVKYLGFYLPEP